MKKNYFMNKCYGEITRFKQFFKIMRIAVILLFTGISFVAANEYNSKGANVNINKSAETASVAQTQRSVVVIVKDALEEVIGANVVVKGTTIGNTTDIDGRAVLNNVPENAVIVVSYIGYVAQEINSGSLTEINVLLKEDFQALEEVVVVGFAKQKKANLTGSVSNIKMDEILGDRPVTTDRKSVV